MFLRGEDVARVVAGGLVQPAGVDLTLGEVEELGGPGRLGRASRSIPPGRRVEPRGGWYRLGPGVYRVRFREVVRVPAWAVGFCYPRSSLLRMGATVSCGVWDPGYYGRGQALLAVLNPAGVELEEGVGVAQFVLARLEGLAGYLYEGAYKGEGVVEKG